MCSSRSAVLRGLLLFGILATVAGGSLQAADPPLATERIASGLAKPVGLTHRPGDATRLYVIEQHSGAIRVIRDGSLLATPLLTVPDVSTGGEQGLLGLAFHPDPGDDRFFVYLTRSDGAGVLRSYRFAATPDQADAGSGRDLLVIPQPQSNHNGGWLAFGPQDDLLHLGLGDGGGGGDDDSGHGTIGNGQATATLLGKILRLDIDVPPGTPGDPPYLIPAGNPSLPGIANTGAAAPARPEILHFGLRNPWRCGFDPADGALYIGDVGQGSLEEISVAAAGSVGLNFGWRVYEGTQVHKSGDAIPDPPALPPIHEYPRGDGKAVIGGSVYRGTAIAGLQGTYFFADYVSGRIWSLRYDGSSVSAFTERTSELAPAVGSLASPSSFGTDAAGELYLCARGGEVHRIVAASTGQAPSITSTPITSAVVGQPYTYQVTASGNPAPTFSLDTAPSGMAIDPASGLISWTPGAATSAAVTVRASNGIAPAATQAFSITVAALRPPEDPPLADLAAGLDSSRYQGSWSVLPDFDTLVAVEAGVVANLQISAAEQMAWRFSGFLEVPADGLYTFTTRSDDGSALFIGTTRVVDNDGLHGPQEASGSIALAAGRHALTVTFFEASGGEELGMRWQGPGIPASVTIPDAALYRYATPYGRDRYVGTAPYLGSAAIAAGTPPALLSATGVFADLAELRPSAGLLPYTVNSPLWSDGAVKRRWIAVPDGAGIVFDATGNWSFPAGTVLVKHFELGAEARRVETRLLVLTGSGNAYGVTYRWREDGSDADLLTAGATADLSVDGGVQSWRFPSSQQCLECHTPQTDRVLGVRTRQLNGTALYPSTGRSDNQLRSWNHLGLFSAAIDEGDIAGYQQLVAVDDAGAGLEHRVRSYLDANCMMCHQPGASPALFDARFSTPLADQGIVDGPVNDPLGVTGARVVAPGDLTRSLLHRRVHSLDPAIRMPPLASLQRDQAAVDAIAAWIASLATGPVITAGPNADPDPVTGTASSLSVSADGVDPAALSYTWTTVAAPPGAPAPQFSPNGGNAAASTTVSFGRAGSYTLQVTVSDGAGSVAATIEVQVQQTASAISVVP